MTNYALKRHMISIGITFVSTFFLVISFEIGNPDFVFSTDAIKVVALSGITAGARAVGKMIYELCYSLLNK